MQTGVDHKLLLFPTLSEFLSLEQHPRFVLLLLKLFLEALAEQIYNSREDFPYMSTNSSVPEWKPSPSISC